MRQLKSPARVIGVAIALLLALSVAASAQVVRRPPGPPPPPPAKPRPPTGSPDIKPKPADPASPSVKRAPRASARPAEQPQVAGPQGAGGGAGAAALNFALPRACFAHDAIMEVPTCDIISSGTLMYEIKEAETWAGLFRILFKPSLTRAVGISFANGEALNQKLDLIAEMYEAQLSIFFQIRERARTVLVEDPRLRPVLHQFAIDDAGDVGELQMAAVQEAQQQKDAAASYLESNPRSSNVRFHCRTACGQLIRLATGMGMWP